MTAPVLVAVSHGTRDPQGAAAVVQLVEAVRRKRPGLRLELGWLGLLRPSLAEVLTRLGGKPAVLVPLLLGAGYHIRADLPRIVAGVSGCRVRVAGPLGPHPLLAEALRDRLTEAGWTAARGPVVLAAAGSAEPGADAATRRMADLLGQRLGTPVAASYLGTGSPTPAQALAALRGGGHRAVAVARYLMAPGFFADQALTCGGTVTTAPLGAHDAVARLILRRYDAQAARGAGEPAGAWHRRAR